MVVHTFLLGSYLLYITKQRQLSKIYFMHAYHTHGKKKKTRKDPCEAQCG